MTPKVDAFVPGMSSVVGLVTAVSKVDGSVPGGSKIDELAPGVSKIDGLLPGALTVTPKVDAFVPFFQVRKAKAKQGGQQVRIQSRSDFDPQNSIPKRLTDSICSRYKKCQVSSSSWYQTCLGWSSA